jgi:flagellar biosynthesis protein FlhG
LTTIPSLPPTNPSHQAAQLAIPRPSPTPWLAIAGAKGGVGKTTLAVQLALHFARGGHRTLLVDFDPGCGNVGVHLRLSAPLDLEDVATGACAARDAVVDGPSGLGVLLGRSGPTALVGDDSAARDRALRAIEQLAPEFDVVVFDTGAGLGPATMAIAERADLLLGVTTPDAAALTDAYALCKVMHLRGRPLPRLVVNRVASRDEAMRTAAKLTAVSRKFLGAETAFFGHVGNDARIERAVQQQQPGNALGNGHGGDDLRALAATILATMPPLARRRAPLDLRQVRLRPTPN